MASARRIRAAILSLNPKWDAHWTTGGKPDLDTLKEIVGSRVKRSECPPKLTRDYVRGKNAANLEKAAHRSDAAAKKGDPRAAPAAMGVIVGALMGTTRNPAEVSAYQSAINAMDEAVNAFGAIKTGRQNSEFRHALRVYTDARPGIIEHFNRVKERKG